MDKWIKTLTPSPEWHNREVLEHNYADWAVSHLRVLYVISWTSTPKSSLAACLNTCSRKPSEPLPSCLTSATSPPSPSLQSQSKLHWHRLRGCSQSRKHYTSKYNLLTLQLHSTDVIVYIIKNNALSYSHLVQWNWVQLLHRHLPLLHQVINLPWNMKHDSYFDSALFHYPLQHSLATLLATPV